MEKNTLTFDNTGFTYDLENPTKQTEELSFILKNALLATTPINIRQENDEEFEDRIEREVLALGHLSDLKDSIKDLKDCIAFMGGSDPENPDWLESLFNYIVHAINNVQGILYVLTVYLKGENSEAPNLLQALDTIAASTGIFMDAPGLSIIDKPELI